MLVRELTEALFGFFPQDDAEPWDHVGLSVGDPEAKITGVFVALDATEEAVRQAAEAGCNVLVTHHPVYIEAPSVFAPASPRVSHASATVYAAARRGLSIISMHTNLDRSVAVRTCFADLMDLPCVSSLEQYDDPHVPGLGSVCDGAECSLGSFVKRVANSFDGVPRVWGVPDMPLRRVAFLGGSLGDFGELALKHDVDAIVTGEVGYHRAQDLLLRGCGVIELGHDISEFPFVDILANHVVLAGVDPQLVSKIVRPKQWWTYDKGVIS